MAIGQGALVRLMWDMAGYARSESAKAGKRCVEMYKRFILIEH